MNNLTVQSHFNDVSSFRRYTGFPLNSTLVKSYTTDSLRSIISHAASGKPFTTAVWIRINRAGIQISAQDPQIARTRLPVFIPIALINDIFIQSNINNVICIVYDEIKSNMKGVLLYVVHPTDVQLLREDFRSVKQLYYSNNVDNAVLMDPNSKENNRLFSQANDVFHFIRNSRQYSPKRILYMNNGEINANKELTTTSVPPSLPQLSYTPFKGSHHGSRDNSVHRRHKSPKKIKGARSPSKTASDKEGNHRQKYRSRSPQKQVKVQSPVHDENRDLANEQTEKQESEQQQHAIPWQAVQQVPIISAGIYNRYVPKAIPLPTGDTIKTTIPSPHTNGTIVAHLESKSNGNTEIVNDSPSPSHSNSPIPPESTENDQLSNTIDKVTPSYNRYHHHHHHHHHKSHNRYSSPKADSSMYKTISHPSRARPKYNPIPLASNNNQNNNNNNNNDDITKQYLKQLIDDMQAMKIEMNRIRVVSSSNGTVRGRSDALRINLNQLRNEIDDLRAQLSMNSKSLD